MEYWYIVLNIILLAALFLFMRTRVYPDEYGDVIALNKQFDTIKHNTECINYLQNVAVTPTWRFSLFSALGFTIIELLLYVLAGGILTEKKHVFAFWILFLLNWLFMYKSLSTRSWHYMCNHGCSPNFKQ